MSGVQWFMTVTRRGSVVHTVVHAAVVTRRAQSLLPLLAVAVLATLVPRACADAVTVPAPPAGAVDGYLSLQQLTEYFSTLHGLLPSVVGPRVELGTTMQSRPVDAYCIGDCVLDTAVDAGDVRRPGLLLTGMHHSREVRQGDGRLLAACVDSLGRDLLMNTRGLLPIVCNRC